MENKFVTNETEVKLVDALFSVYEDAKVTEENPDVSPEKQHFAYQVAVELANPYVMILTALGIEVEEVLEQNPDLEERRVTIFEE